MTVSTPIRWQAQAGRPRGSVRAATARGRLLGAGAAGSPEFEVIRPGAFFAQLGRDAKIGFRDSYLAYGEAGFRSGYLGVSQLQLAREGTA